MANGGTEAARAVESHSVEKKDGSLQEVVLDVSDLEPPDPLVRTLEAVETLQPGQYLRMLHRREPCLLFPHLDQQGFSYIMREGRTAACEVLIWRAEDAQAAAVIHGSNAASRRASP